MSFVYKEFYDYESGTHYLLIAPLLSGVAGLSALSSSKTDTLSTMNILYNNKYELVLTRRAKAYSSSCSQIVLAYLQPFRRNSVLKCAPQSQIAKINKTPYFGSSGSFKVIDVDTTKKLVTSACCDRQHAHAYLQPLSRKTG